jgi:hypothetical protein
MFKGFDKKNNNRLKQKSQMIKPPTVIGAA